MRSLPTVDAQRGRTNSPEQHGKLLAPHCRQLLLAHTSSVELQVVPWQHGWPMPPHDGGLTPQLALAAQHAISSSKDNSENQGT